MSVADIIREHTHALRDSIALLEGEIASLEAERDAADERFKRCSTEISRERNLEGERKRSWQAAGQRVVEAQEVLDELGRKRQEALEVLMRCQEEEKAIAISVCDAQRATEAARTEIQREEKAGTKAQDRLTRLHGTHADKRQQLCRARLDALDVHLRRQAEQVRAAFTTQEERAEAMRELEEFNRKRHTDPRIAELWEQREELRKLLKTSMVPGVKNLLQSSLNDIQDELAKTFPQATEVSEFPPADNPIDELLYYFDSDGNVVFLLPIDPNDWDAAENGEGTDGANRAMCLAWSVIRGLPLKTQDGDFVKVRGRPAFESRFDLDDAAVLSEFSLTSDESVVMRLIPAPAPQEVQEALSHEGSDL
jgi:hypothetical protein